MGRNYHINCAAAAGVVWDASSRSPTSPNSWQQEEDRPLSPSVAQGQTKNMKFAGGDNTDGGSAVVHPHMQQQQQQQQHGMDMSGSMDNRSMLATGHYGQQQMQQHQQQHDQQQQQLQIPPHAVETSFDVDGNVVETETKSISSVKSTGSGGQEATR